MDYFTIGAGVWVVIFALLGVIKGFWKSLAAAASLVAAYWASVSFAPALAAAAQRQFADANFNDTLVWAFSATAIFILTGLLVRVVILALAKSLPINNGFINRTGGGLISAGYGAVLGVVLLWGLAFLADTWNLREEKSADGTPAFDTSSPVVTFSRRMMSRWVNWNVQQSGGSEAVAGMSAAMAERPAEVMADVRATVRSPEFKQMVESENVRTIVQQKNSEALRQTAEFQQFLQQPAVRELRERMPKEFTWSDAEIAEETVTLWTRVDEIKNNPEVANILNDPEVAAFLRGDGKITPSLMAKGQQLLALLGNDAATLTKVAVPGFFQWYDDEGQLHITDEASVPANKKAEAKPVQIK